MPDFLFKIAKLAYEYFRPRLLELVQQSPNPFDDLMIAILDRIFEVEAEGVVHGQRGTGRKAFRPA